MPSTPSHSRSASPVRTPSSSPPSPISRSLYSPPDIPSLLMPPCQSPVLSSNGLIPQPPTLTTNPPHVHPTYINPFGERLSAAEQEWQRQKDEEGAKNDAIDELMKLVGLEEVKEQVLAIKAKVDTCRRQGTNLERERFSIVFQGNPGTGKTTVARIYSKFLESSGVLHSGVLKETSGAKLAYKGPRGAKRLMREKILHRGGGVLFVDEAYQLTAPHTAASGRQVLDIILTEMENHIGKLVVIFVGYNKEMQSFFEHNPGLASRVPYTLHFTDFKHEELWCILRDSIDEKYSRKMMIEDGMDGLYMRIAVRRLARGRDTRDFGNARSVQNLLARISERQARRLTKQRKDDPDHFYFTKEDLIGPDPSEAIFESAAWAKLQNLIGLDGVKKSARAMIDMIVTNYLREIAEKSPLDFSLNRVFFGSPGTGKTTVAKLYGQILADLELLSNGEVIIKNPSDFIGECLGKSEAKTRAILAATIGKVLIIDEAYMLNSGGTGQQSDSYKMAVIDTLVAEVQSVPGDDRCILLLGYEDNLKEMFHNVNPGLSRRFSIEDPFRFQDFTVPQLEEVLKLKMKEQDLSATPQALSVALEILDRARMRPNFCNGGEVENCLAKAKLNYQARQSKKPVHERASDAVFEPEDFDPDFNRNSNAIANCRELLKGKVGDDIIRKLEGYQRLSLVMRANGIDPREQLPTNFIFKGPPGTGKSTTARNMGQIYYDMGFLSTNEVIECSASDLIGEFVGHTGPKTKTQLDRALGKVLFVDEAHRLTQGQYETEAVTELIFHLGTPKYAGKIVIVLAGHTQDMNKLMTARSTLSSLFPEEIIFENIRPKECLTLLYRELQQKRISAPFLADPSSSGYHKLLRLVGVLSDFPSWSNARDIKTLAKEMSGTSFSETSIHCTPTPTLSAGQAVNLSVEQAVNCTLRMIRMQDERFSGKKEQTVKCPPMAFECAQGPITAHDVAPCYDKSTANTLDQTEAPPQPPLPPSPPVSCFRPLPNTGATRDEGVSDAIWDQLQDDKENAERTSKNATTTLKRLQQKINDLKARESALIESAEKAEEAIPRDDTDRTALKGRIKDSRLEAARLRNMREDDEGELEKSLQEQKEREEREQAVQQRLRQMGVCPMGYQWIRGSGGYRCEGGSHFMSDRQLGI